MRVVSPPLRLHGRRTPFEVEMCVGGLYHRTGADGHANGIGDRLQQLGPVPPLADVASMDLDALATQVRRRHIVRETGELARLPVPHAGTEFNVSRCAVREDPQHEDGPRGGH